MRRAALILFVLLAAACDKVDKAEAFTDPRLPPGLETRFWPPEGWAWGLIQVKGEDDPIRYGVAAPNGEARADVIILTSHGESAEMWFETANALIARGYAVWVLEGSGEGGSGRNHANRALGHVESFDADIRALPALDRLVVRPRRSVVVIASGTAAFPAMAAVQRGYQPDLLILSGPFEPRTEGWKRPEPGDRLTPRRRALAGWAVANPDLRMGGVSRRWLSEHRKLKGAVTAAEAQKGVRAPVVVVSQPTGTLRCGDIPACREVATAGTEAYLFEADSIRNQWLGTIFSSLPN